MVEVVVVPVVVVVVVFVVMVVNVVVVVMVLVVDTVGITKINKTIKTSHFGNCNSISQFFPKNFLIVPNQLQGYSILIFVLTFKSNIQLSYLYRY